MDEPRIPQQFCLTREQAAELYEQLGRGIEAMETKIDQLGWTASERFAANYLTIIRLRLGDYLKRQGRPK